MSGSFSLVEKLAVAGAFCAIVAMGVGTETDPGVVAETKLKPGQTLASATVVQGKNAKSNYWSFSGDGSTAPADDARPAPPPPEILPPGFGATPSPDLPQ